MIRVLIVEYEASIQQVYVSDDSAIEVLVFHYSKDDSKSSYEQIDKFIDHETRHLVKLDHTEHSIVEQIALQQQLEREAEAEREYEGKS